MTVLKIKTPVGNEFYIDSEDLKHYKNAEILETIEDEVAEVPEEE